MHRVDVAVVGAGPAGSSTALHLLARRPGLRVALFDRARLPRTKPCGGAISRWGLDALSSLGATPAELGVDHVPVRAIRVRFREACAEHVASAPVGVVVERAVFDAALARRAVERGAVVHDDHRLVALGAYDGRDRARRLTFARGDGATVDVEAGLVVGADGTGSAVRRLEGLPERGPRARLLVVETDPGPHEDVLRGDGGVLEFDLSCLDRGIDGYVWHFATAFGGARRVSRGVFDFRGLRAGDAGALRAVLADATAARGVDPRAVAPKPYSERVFVTEGSASTAVTAARGLVMAGEAAGLVDPVTGEGIAQAIVSGRVAADELVRAMDGGGVDPERHRRALVSLRWHRHLRQTATLAPIVYGARATTWASALARSARAVEAGARWYTGEPLGAARKVRVGLDFAARLALASLRVDRGASAE